MLGSCHNSLKLLDFIDSNASIRWMQAGFVEIRHKALVLALRTIDGTAATQSGFFQGVATGFARFASPSVRIQLLLKIPGLAMTIHKVTQGCASALDGKSKNPAHLFCQPVKASGADASGSAQGVYPGFEERFVGVDIPDADHDMTVHQKAFDGGAAAA
jgi:hypothetical protein